jgi:hypothetical protein
MRHLRAAGLSCAAIATVMRLDHGLLLTEQQVRRSLQDNSETVAA